MVQLTPQTVEDFAQYLEGRGCYTENTVRRKVYNARILQTNIPNFPLDEDIAVRQIWDVGGISPKRRRELNTTARDMIEFFEKEAATS